MMMIKIEAGYQLLVITFLLSLQDSQGLLGCGAYERPNRTDIEKCVLIEEVFENALLSDKTNLHILRDTFLSSLHPSPHLLDIDYYVITDDDFDLIKTTWTNSKVFTVIDSPILHNFQSGIMMLIYYMEGKLFPQVIHLQLNISGFNFSIGEYLYGTIIITQRLKPYAISQTKFSNWNGENKGYVLSELNEYKILMLFATLTFIVIGMVVSWRLVTHMIASEEDYDTDIKRSLFWSSIKILVFTNSIEILVLVILLITPFRNISAIFCGFKLVLITSIGIAGIMLGFCVPDKNESATSCSITMNQVKYSCALCNFFIFAFFVGISIVSTTAMIVVHPILVLSTILCVCTTIFSFSVQLAIPNSFESMRRRIIKKNHQKYYSYLCNCLLFVLLVIAINSIALLYLAILSKVDHTYTDSVIQDVSSILPSIIPGIIGWYFAMNKLTMKRKKGLNEDSDTDIDSEKELELSTVQKKTNLSSSAMKPVEDRELAISDNESELSKLLPDTEETAL